MSADPCKTHFLAYDAARCRPEGDVWKFTAVCAVDAEHGRSVQVNEGVDRSAVIYTTCRCSPHEQTAALGLSMSDARRDDHADDKATLERWPWPAPLNDAALHGIAGAFVRTIGPHSEADPVALLVQFLAAFGCMIGSSAGVRIEGTRHPGANLAAVDRADRDARKGTAAGRVNEVMDLADPDWRREHVRAGLASGEGVVWHVRDPITKRRKAKAKEVLRRTWTRTATWSKRKTPA